MRVYVKRRVRFSAAHNYSNIPAGLVSDIDQTGQSKSRAGHGHNYVVDLTCAGETSPDTGMVVNITEIDQLLKELLAPLDQTHLEIDHPNVAGGLPTTENLARWVWQNCDGALPGADLTSVVVRESEFLWAEYKGDIDAMVYVTRSYEFSAAHRLHSDCLSDTENIEVFGKCNNPNGHGHNYKVEVTLKGQVHERTGMACSIGRLDATVARRVLDRLDHKHLNLDVPEFAGIVPTSENVAVVIWNLLHGELGESLHRICVGETERNYFEYYGEG